MERVSETVSEPMGHEQIIRTRRLRPRVSEGTDLFRVAGAIRRDGGGRHSPATIRWTIQQVSMQAHFMGEVIEHVPGYRKSYGYVLAENCDPSIAAAVQALFDRRVGASAICAVIKLHSLAGVSTDPRQWVRLSGKDWQKVHSIITKRDLWRPAYRWKGPNAFADDTNWLGVESSRRFIQFIIRAWKENWPVSGLTEAPEKFLGDSATDKNRSKGGGYRFRDFHLPQELHKIFRHISRFKRPCVVCSWG
jgi:hypothetical protein